jgi:signal peptidase II
MLHSVGHQPLATPGRIAVIVAGLVLVLDNLTKSLATEIFHRPHRVHHLIEINVLRNSGGVVLRGTTGALLGSGGAVVLIVGGPVVARWLSSRLGSVACGLFVGGAAGNLADRLVRTPGQMRGPILDWLTVSKGLLPTTFTMNLADVALISGLAIALPLAVRKSASAPSEHLTVLGASADTESHPVLARAPLRSARRNDTV